MRALFFRVLFSCAGFPFCPLSLCNHAHLLSSAFTLESLLYGVRGPLCTWLCRVCSLLRHLLTCICLFLTLLRGILCQPLRVSLVLSLYYYTQSHHCCISPDYVCCSPAFRSPLRVRLTSGPFSSSSLILLCLFVAGRAGGSGCGHGYPDFR